MVHLRHDAIVNVTTLVLFIFLDSLAVLLRIISKGKTKNGFSSDDWWILCALLLFFGWAGLKLYVVAGIAGTLDLGKLKGPQQLEEVLKILWVGEVLFPLTITPIKISILCFYRRIFSTPKFRRATWCMAAVCGLWLFSGFWVTIFQCRPIRAVYDLKLAPGAHCVSFGQFVFIYELLNALIDFCILALPIFMIRKLQMPTRRKLQLLSIFLMGGLVLVACILRMVNLYDPKDPDRVPSYSRAALWCTIELGVSLICACLPTYRPLLPRRLDISDMFKSWYSSLFNVMRSKTGSSSSGTSKAQVFQHSRVDRNKDNATSESDLTEIDGRSDTGTQFPKSGASSFYAVSMGSDLTLFDSSQLPCSKAGIDTWRHDTTDIESQRPPSSGL